MNYTKKFKIFIYYFNHGAGNNWKLTSKQHQNIIISHNT